MNVLLPAGIDIGLLFSLTQRPPIYERSEHNIWTDDHVGRRMLDHHLDPDVDAASLNHETIDRQVAWISRRIGDGDDRGDGNAASVLDIGCGPGLFCERFHDRGFRVTGVDFNRHSLSYATAHAVETGRRISYRAANYLHLELGRRFAAITLINRDFGALTPGERDRLLDRVYRHLAPGGVFVFDVMSNSRYLRQRERSRYRVADGGGFWAPGPHLVLERVFLYEAEQAQVDHYAVLEADGSVRDFRNWTTYYSVDDVERVLTAAGFVIEEMNPYLSDTPYGDPDTNLGFVVRKPR